ncbi:MAG: L-lysine dehydrogenase, partial [Ilumatobacter sp.]|nr:L-lysine dehydrogenase [Ilumatobacter sp.]
MTTHQTPTGAPAIERIAVLGLGRVGTLAARMLHSLGFDVRGHDERPRVTTEEFTQIRTDVTDANALVVALGGVDAVLSCLPYHCNIAVADAAHAAGIHYFDLTEDVPTTAHIRTLADTAQ